MDNQLRFTKLPVTIEAFQMTSERRASNEEWPQWLHEAWNRDGQEPGAVWCVDYPNSDGTDQLCIQTLEGVVTVGWGDYIIRGVQGELYPCKPDIFAATYTVAAEEKKMKAPCDKSDKELAVEQQVADTKQLRKNLDRELQGLKTMSERQDGNDRRRSSRERALARTKLEEAIMWLGMDLKAIAEENPDVDLKNPYPESKNPESNVVHPTADGLKL